MLASVLNLLHGVLHGVTPNGRCCLMILEPRLHCVMITLEQRFPCAPDSMEKEIRSRVRLVKESRLLPLF